MPEIAATSYTSLTNSKCKAELIIITSKTISPFLGTNAFIVKSANLNTLLLLLSILCPFSHLSLSILPYNTCFSYYYYMIHAEKAA